MDTPLMINAETKVLKQRVRDHIDPGRDLGHSDKHGKKKQEEDESSKGDKQSQAISGDGADVKKNLDGTVCEDCK